MKMYRKIKNKIILWFYRKVWEGKRKGFIYHWTFFKFQKNWLWFYVLGHEMCTFQQPPAKKILKEVLKNIDISKYKKEKLPVILLAECLKLYKYADPEDIKKTIKQYALAM